MSTEPTNAKPAAGGPDQGFATYTLVIVAVIVAAIVLFFLGRWLLDLWTARQGTVRIPNEQGTITLTVTVQNLPAVAIVPSGDPPEQVPVTPNGVFEVIQNNCGGDEVLFNTIERSRTVVYQATVGGQAPDTAGKLRLPLLGQEVEVATPLANYYGVTYGTAEAITHSLTISTTPGMNVVHQLQQVDYWETGALVWRIGAGAVTYPYRFRTDAGIVFVTSQDVGCE